MTIRRNLRVIAYRTVPGDTRRALICASLEAQEATIPARATLAFRRVEPYGAGTLGAGDPPRVSPGTLPAGAPVRRPESHRAPISARDGLRDSHHVNGLTGPLPCGPSRLT
jgi:hypothetical protein